MRRLDGRKGAGNDDLTILRLVTALECLAPQCGQYGRDSDGSRSASHAPQLALPPRTLNQAYIHFLGGRN